MRPAIPSCSTLFATEAPVEEDDGEFFGTFAISPATHVRDLDEAYGPLSITDSERGKTVAEMITQRLGGRGDYADRVRLGAIVLIVRDIDEHGHIASVGVSMEPVEPPPPGRSSSISANSFWQAAIICVANAARRGWINTGEK